MSLKEVRSQLLISHDEGVINARGGGVLPYKRLMGMCRWMGSHFHDWSDYNGVAFSIELLEWGRKFSAVWGFKMGRISDKKIRKLLFIKFNNKLALTALHSVLETAT